MTDIVELARNRAAAAEVVRALGQVNAYGRTPEEQVAASARYRLAADALMKANQEYEDGIASMSADDLRKLAI